MSDHLPVTLKAVVTYPTSNGLAINPDITYVSCYGESDGEITINAHAGQTPYTYQWDSNAGHQTTQTITGLSAGTYCVTVTDALWETDDICVIVNEPSEINLSVYQNPDNGSCNGEAIVVVSGDVSQYTYQWDDPQNQTTQAALNLCAGIYSVTVTDAAGCSVTEQVTVGSQTSEIDENINAPFKLFPVPFQNELFISLENDIADGRVSILSAVGMKVMEVSMTESHQPLRISTEKLSKGVYFIQFENYNTKFTKQVVKN